MAETIRAGLLQLSDADLATLLQALGSGRANPPYANQPASIRLPDLFYDPAALEEGNKRTILHPKCIVADGRHALASSPKFTQAAFLRNIEMGVLIRSAAIARQLVSHFRGLIEARVMQRFPDSPV